jgi:hypothetical protein
VGGAKEVSYHANDKRAQDDLTRLEAEVKQIKSVMGQRSGQIQQRSNLLKSGGSRFGEQVKADIKNLQVQRATLTVAPRSPVHQCVR